MNKKIWEMLLLKFRNSNKPLNIIKKENELTEVKLKVTELKFATDWDEDAQGLIVSFFN
jgi:hypothetical protein